MRLGLSPGSPSSQPAVAGPLQSPFSLKQIIDVPSGRQLALLGTIAAGYFVAGKLGLALAVVHGSASPLSPGAGIALAVFVILGLRAWPAILLGAFFVNHTATGAIVPSLVIAVGSTVEGALAGYVVTRWARGARFFENARGVVTYAALAAGATTVLGATVAATTLTVSQLAPASAFGLVWLSWWLAGVTGDLVLGAVALTWFVHPRLRWSQEQALEVLALLVGLGITGQLVFGDLSPAAIRHYPLAFLSLPVLLWAPFRLGPREAATAVLILSAMAIFGTLSGSGPFGAFESAPALLLLQQFSAVAAAMSLVVAAVVSERSRVQQRLHELSVSDPLTGLVNYRQLQAVLESEIRRAQRTERPFALLFVDVDGLKEINDTYGHLTGSQALCRVADALRASCRAVDTAARYGGDEFALVLPETDEVSARRVARRVATRLSRDQGRPQVTASLGVAVYPRDGRTAMELLQAADAVLYRRKSRRQSAPSRRRQSLP